MDCPMYVDFTRECGKKIGFLPIDTLEFCSTSRYRECPFYRTINKIGYHCEYLEKCPAYEHFQVADFNKFVAVANDWCLSKDNNHSCKRYKLRRAGKNPPSNLLPDGSLIETEKSK